MGVDIMFYRGKKSLYDQAAEYDKNDNFPHGFFTELDKYEIAYFRGRHLIWRLVTDHFGSQQLAKVDPEVIQSMFAECKTIAEKVIVYHNTAMRMPISKLKKYIKEAEEADEDYINIPFEECESADSFDYDIDDWDYMQAKQFIETDWKCGDDEVIWMIDSY